MALAVDYTFLDVDGKKAQCRLYAPYDVPTPPLIGAWAVSMGEALAALSDCALVEAKVSYKLTFEGNLAEPNSWSAIQLYAI